MTSPIFSGLMFSAITSSKLFGPRIEQSDLEVVEVQLGPDMLDDLLLQEPQAFGNIELRHHRSVQMQQLRPCGGDGLGAATGALIVRDFKQDQQPRSIGGQGSDRFPVVPLVLEVGSPAGRLGKLEHH